MQKRSTVKQSNKFTQLTQLNQRAQISVHTLKRITFNDFNINFIQLSYTS